MNTTFIDGLVITTISNDELDDQDGSSPDGEGTERHLHLGPDDCGLDAVVYGGREAAHELIRLLQAAVAAADVCSSRPSGPEPHEHPLCRCGRELVCTTSCRVSGMFGRVSRCARVRGDSTCPGVGRGVPR